MPSMRTPEFSAGFDLRNTFDAYHVITDSQVIHLAHRHAFRNT